MRVTSPNGGETIDGDTLSVSWTASDADGDPLVFDVQYSADDGATWEVVAQSATGTSTVIDRVNLTASAQARMRVWVSDGIHTGSDTSDAAFDVANALPSIAITSPASDVTAAAGQTLRFAANADDPDLGGMVGEHVEWSSDRDGDLGGGLSVSTSALGIGTHSVTARLDDGRGSVVSDTVRVLVVGDLSELPTPDDALDVAPSPLWFDSTIEETRHTLDIDNLNAEHGVTWQATASVPWLQLSEEAGSTPAETVVAFTGAALPPGHYKATISVTSPGLAAVDVPVDVILAAPPTCLGDCSGDGTVTADELVTGVEIALGARRVAECSPFTRDYDGVVTVDELVAAVGAHGACPSP